MNQQRFDVLVESVGRLARRGALPNALNIVERLRAGDVANVLRHLGERERDALFTALRRRDAAKAAEALSELGPDYIRKLLAPIGVDEVRVLLEAMSSDDAALILGELPESLRDELLEGMQASPGTGVHELLTFGDETAGRIMSPDIFALGEDVTVSEAITALQRRGEEYEMSFYLYVVDARSHLLGVVSLRQLLLNSPSTPLKKIMSTDVIKVRVSTDQEEVARIVATYNLLAVPVVDEEAKLVGMITVDDIIDVIREEATEDIYALAGVDADDRAMGSVANSVRRRLPWLLTSLGTSLLAAAVVNAYRESIREAIAVAVLIPVVASIADNTATQTMTVMVRGIGLSEVTWSQALNALRKECMVGIANGIVLGALAALVVGVWFQSVGLAATIGIALAVNSLVACLAGATIPFVLKRMRLDPAVASNAFVVTLTAIVGLAVYLSIAEVILR
jgi:magnesium transporter